MSLNEVHLSELTMYINQLKLSGFKCVYHISYMGFI